jgi:hypothetical protein
VRWHISEVFALPSAGVEDMQGAISYVPCRCHRKYLLEAAEERCTAVTAESRPGHIEPGDWVPKMLKKERVPLEVDGVSLDLHVCVRPVWEAKKKPAVALPESAHFLCCLCPAALEARECDRPRRSKVASGVLAFGCAQGGGGGGVELVCCGEEYLSVPHGFREKDQVISEQDGNEAAALVEEGDIACRGVDRVGAVKGDGDPVD